MAALYKNKVLAPFNFLVQFVPSELASAIAESFNARTAGGTTAAAVDVDHARAAMRAVLSLGPGDVRTVTARQKAMQWRSSLGVDEQRFSVLLDFTTALAEVVFAEFGIGGHRRLFALALRSK